MLNRITLIINFSLGCISILNFYFFEGTEHYMRFILDVIIIVLIFSMAVVTIINTPQWYKTAMSKNETVKLIHGVVAISYVFVLISLII